MTSPRSIPATHHQFIRTLVERLKTDKRIVGVAAGGSYLTDSMDEFSDVDLVIAVEPRDFADVTADRHAIAASLGRLLAAFTGEHVGEPRVLICLYDEPLLHVDLKFVQLDDVARRIEDPAILWEREGQFTRALTQAEAEYPVADLDWIEQRFWIWIHYAAARVGRGELFEALDFLSFLRGTVLGPLGLLRAGARSVRVRRIETAAPEFAQELRRTVATYDAADCLRALRACVELYRSVQPDSNVAGAGGEAERAALEYLSRIERQHGVPSG
jgi:predicted nucleotidyltransferase